MLLLVTCLPLAGDVNYTITTVAGSSAAGDGGAAANALLLQAEGLAFDSAGNLYVADAADHRVRKVTTSGQISTVAGNGTAGFSGDGGQATSAQLNSPYGVSFDSLGVLYIADLGNRRVRRVRVDGVIETVAGGGTLDPLTGGGSSATQVRLDSPRNVAVDSTGAIYISDFGANRLYRVTQGKIYVYAGGGSAGAPADGVPAGSIELLAPAGLVVGAGDRIYLAAPGSKRVFRFQNGISYLVQVQGLTAPTGVALDSTGMLYIADRAHGSTFQVLPNGNSSELAIAGRDVALLGGSVYLSDGRVVRRITPTGVISVFAGTTGAFTGDNGPVQLSRLSLPSGVCVDSTGVQYIADTGAHRVRRVALDGTITTWAGTGEAGYSGDAGPGSAAKLSAPAAVALDKSGNVYVADTGNHVIRKITPAGTISTVAGTGTGGFSGDNIQATVGALNSPAGVAVDANGILYIADTANHRVRKVYATGIIVTLAGTGIAGWSGDGGSAVNAQLRSPTALSVDDNGIVYVADSGNNVIRRIGKDGVIVSITQAVPSTWNSPQGVAYSNGDVIVADTGNHRILRVTSTGYVQVIAGTATAGFSGDSGPAIEAALNSPRGLWGDSQGAIYFADAGNRRIRKLTPASSSTDPGGSTGLSTTGTAKVVSIGSYLEGSIAPGQLVALLGSGLGPIAGVSAPPTVGAPVGTTLGGVQVTFDGTAAPLLYVQDTQVNLQVPYNVSGKNSTTISVSYLGTVKWSGLVAVTDSSPALMTVGLGTGPALAVNADGTLNSNAAAARGSTVTLFGTGAGVMSPAMVDGKPAAIPLAIPAQTVQVLVGDSTAEVVTASAAAGFIGLLQVNVRLPGTQTPAGTLPVRLVVGNRMSQTGVTLALK